MGVKCAVTVTGPDGFDRARRALAEIGRLETLWTRFSAQSDLGRMNLSAGRPVFVHPDTVTLVATMLEAHRATHGLFDPSMLPEQLAAGDTRSLVDDRTTETVPAVPNHDLGSVRILDGCTVQLPGGMSLDAGGIGKGLAADLIADRTVADGADGVCVNIGGDLACRGVPPEGGWTVSGAPPHDFSATIAVLSVENGAVATSSVNARQWRNDRRTVHLMDPRTHRESDGEIAGATVVASSAAWAEAFTKFAMLSPGALPYLENLGLACMTVGHDGTVTSNEPWARFVR
jgi:thiamine biosynthesis lipoprotein